MKRWVPVVLLVVGFFLGESAAALTVDRIVVVVNDEVITLSELQEEALRSGTLPREALSDRVRLLEVLRPMIEARLLVQEARRENLRVSKDDVDAAVEDIKRTNRLNDEAFRKALWRDGITLEEYRKHLADQILAARIMEREVHSRAVVGDDEVHAYYKKHLERFQVPREVRVRHLLLPLPADAPEEDAQRAMAQASALRTQVQEGADFAQVIRDHSKDPSAAYGGDLGFIHPGTLDPTFEEAVFALQPGQIAGPIRTPHGVHLVRVEAVRGGSPKPLEDVREEILSILQKEKAETYYESWIREIKLRAYIDFKL